MTASLVLDLFGFMPADAADPEVVAVEKLPGAPAVSNVRAIQLVSSLQEPTCAEVVWSARSSPPLTLAMERSRGSARCASTSRPPRSASRGSRSSEPSRPWSRPMRAARFLQGCALGQKRGSCLPPAEFAASGGQAIRIRGALPKYGYPSQLSL